MTSPSWAAICRATVWAAFFFNDLATWVEPVMSTVDEFPIAYIVKRIHDFVRRDQPIMYAQALAGPTYSCSIDASLGCFWLHIFNEHSEINTTVYQAVYQAAGRTKLLHVKDGVLLPRNRDIDPDTVRTILDEFLPILEQALVLDDLSSV